MGESREGMRKGLLWRLVQACTSKCQALEEGMSGVCGKRAPGIASTERSSGIQAGKRLPKMCAALGVVGRGFQGVESRAGRLDFDAAVQKNRLN